MKKLDLVDIILTIPKDQKEAFLKHIQDLQDNAEFDIFDVNEAEVLEPWWIDE